MIEIGLVEEISSGPSLAIRALHTRGRVLAITAIPDPSHIGVLLGAGAHAVLTMQNSMSDLLDAIDATVGGRAVHDAVALAAYRDAARARILEGAERQRRLASLTTSERMVLDLLRAGQTAAEIAANRHVSVTTVRGHIRAVLCKLGVNSQLGAVVYAIGEVGDQTS